MRGKTRIGPVPGSRSFTTDGGVSVPTVSASQMREIDRIAIEGQTPNLYQMMENAGRSLADVVARHLGTHWRHVPVTVVVGTGGNGGGGIAAARHLANRGGDVTVVMSRESSLSKMLEQQLDIYMMTKGRLGESIRAGTGLILDALIGYGLTGEPRGMVAEVIEAVNEADAPVVSLDLPSGLDADSGLAPGIVVVATETLTLALPKPGLFAMVVGDVWLADLGIPFGVYQRIGIEPSPRIFEHGPVVHLNRGAP